MSSQEPTLRDLLELIWKARIFVGTGAFLGLIFAVVFILFSTPYYKATMIVAPADGYALGDYASSLSYDQMTSLPFWRPMDPEGVSTDFYRFVHTATGPSVADVLLKDEGVLAGIRKDKSWLKEANSWTAEELAHYLNKYIKIDPLGNTPLRRFSYLHPDREFAAALLRKIHLVSDQMIRRDRKRQSQNRVEYLQKSLETTKHPDHRKIITNLLMQQEHIRMLANMDEAYSAIIVEPAFSGPKPHWPNKILVFPIMILAGALAGFIIWSVQKRDHG